MVIINNKFSMAFIVSYREISSYSISKLDRINKIITGNMSFVYYYSIYHILINELDPIPHKIFDSLKVVDRPWIENF